LALPGCGGSSTVTEVISARIRQVAVFEVREHERRADDVADVARTGSDVAEAVPASDEEANPRSPRQRMDRSKAL
jgi:hypothetical protein